jgi:hypothetical protein
MSWRVLGRAALAVAAIPALGCQSEPAAHEHAANPALRPMPAPTGGGPVDADRAALARFVGVWDFDGWSARPGQEHKQARGRAAATIESQYFVLMDVQATAGAPGRGGHKSGSMLLASEPGVGVTLTAWGDGSPSISRLLGRSEGNGSAFVFNEERTPSGVHPTSITIVFETNDKWVAEIHDVAATGKPVIASYTFTRSAQ